MHSKDEIARKDGSQRHRHIAMFLWIFLGFLHISVISQWWVVSRRDQVFTAYIDHVMQTAANEQRAAKDVRALLLIKAEDLSLPVQGGDVHITGGGQTMKATVHYNADITMPIVNQSVYRIRFDHDLTLK